MKTKIRPFFGMLTFFLTAVSLYAQSPAPPDTSVQINKAGSFGSVAGFGVDNSSSPTNLIVPLNLTVKGPNPYIDVTAYGARAVTLPEPISTVTISGGSPTAHISPANFISGDGVTLIGAGATNTSSTPSAPTVIPSVANGGMQTGVVAAAALSGATNVGSTTYNYVIQGIRQNGGLTAMSAPVSTTTIGNALGAVAYTISTLARSNNTVTVTLSSSHFLNKSCAVGACGVVYIHDSTDASFSGYFRINSVPSNTTFTYLQGMDTRAGASASATGGSAQIYSCNHIVLPAFSAGVIKYLIFGRTGATGTLVPVGVSRINELTFDDFGSPMMDGITLPSYFPAHPSASATNDNFTTTILSGGGTITLTLAANAITGVSGAAIKFDDGPGIAAAAAIAVASGTNGTLHFPAPLNLGTGPQYVVNSYTTIPGLSIWQQGPITLNETLQFGSGMHWYGDVGSPYCSQPQFAWFCGEPITVNGAYPGLYGTAGGVEVFQGLTFSAKNQGLIMVMDDVSGFNNLFERDNFFVGSSGADYMGMGLVLRGTTNNVFHQVLFESSDPASFGSSLTPLLLLRDDTTTTQGAGSFLMDNPFFVGRGIVVDSTPNIGGGVEYRMSGCYAQALRSPMVAFTTNGRSNIIHMDHCTNDTSTTPYLANWGSVLSGSGITALGSTNGEAGGFPGAVSGGPIAGLQVSNIFGPVGQNRDVLNLTNNLMKVSTYAPASVGASQVLADFQVGGPMHFPAQNTLYFDLPSPTGVTAAVASGGSVPDTPPFNNWTYEVSAIGQDNGETVPSVPSTACVTTSGNQTCNIAWTGAAGDVRYTVYRSNGSGYAGVQGCENISVATCSDTHASGDGSTTPVIDTGTGSTSLGPTQVITPQLLLTSALNSNPISYMGTMTPGVLSANQAYTLPNATGTLALAPSIAKKTSNYTMLTTDGTILCNGTITITLQASGILGETHRIKYIASGGSCTVSSTVNIDGATSKVLNTQYQSIDVQWDGTQWWIL